ncbi:hypothetical protein SteCoe_4508 [Stentor coeruleus]|uniref:Uncharacterized protein n=1 Tax=Stentor coeruleus TaxID=5963 RepID=A0A1R2CUE3_9CILI|nr:hypothetical protein SteCoe_4508 [Stentor coeruleus]
MVKKESESFKDHGSYSTFEDFIESCSDLDNPPIIKSLEIQTETLTTEHIFRLQQTRKMTIKTCKSLNYLVLTLYHGDSQNLETIIKYSKLYTRKVIKNTLKPNALIQEKFTKALPVFIQTIKILLHCKIETTPIACKFLKLSLKLVKHLNDPSSKNDILKLMISFSLKTGNENFIGQLFDKKIFGDLSTSFSILICNNVELGLNHKNLEIISEIATSHIGPFQACALDLVTKLLGYMKNHSQALSQKFYTFYNLLINTVIKVYKNDGKNKKFEKILGKFSHLSLAYLAICPSSHLLLKLNIIKEMVKFEKHFSIYVSGIIPHIYTVLAHPILYKRSKSLRVTQVVLIDKIALSKEEETSEAYKQALVDFALNLLDSHINYLNSISPVSIQPIKAFLVDLQKSNPPTILAEKLLGFIKHLKS